MVERLTDPDTGAAHIEGEGGEYVLQTHVDHCLAYLFYVDEAEDAAYSDGEPTLPAVETGEQSFPAGSGVSLGVLVSALHELLDTNRRPTVLSWRALSFH